MKAPSVDRSPVLGLAAILLAFSGALSPVWLLGHIYPKLGALAHGGIAVLGLALLGTELLVRGRIRFPLMAVFGLMPWVYLVCTAFTHTRLEGAFVYLYDFAPYLGAGVLWLVLRRVSDRAVFWTVLAIGTFISLRALFVFLLPSHSPQRQEMAQAVDAFFVYEWVGGLPRVFFPAAPLVFLGVLIAVRTSLRLEGWAQWACFAYCFLGLAALLVTMTRGILLVAAIILVVQGVWCVLDSTADWRKRLNLVTGTLLVGGALAAVILASGYGDALLKRFGGAADRINFDESTMIWRQDQADAALSMMKDTADWVLGVGPTATVPLSHGTLNQLHFGFHSVLWTFGVLGLSLLVLMLVHVLSGAFLAPRKRAYWREAALAIVFIVITGAYTGVFTLPDGAVVLAMAAAYLWLPDPVSDRVAATQPTGATAAAPGWSSRRGVAVPSRRWSAQIRPRPVGPGPADRAKHS